MVAKKDCRKMLVPKKDRLIVYRYLFKEGVMVAKKDCNKPKHDDPELDVKNIYVIKLLTSLKSRGYVTESFSWQWYYWYLTNEGIEYLREYLHLPSDVVPSTLKQTIRRSDREGGGDREGGKGGGWGGKGDREGGKGGWGGGGDGYRRNFEGGGKGGGFGGKGGEGGFGKGGSKGGGF